MSDEVIKFAPASEVQSQFLKSNAMFTIYGGSMGGGKSYSGLMRFMRWLDDPNFVGFAIRKEETVMRADGGLFSEAQQMFSVYDDAMRPTQRPMKLKFNSGASISFAGLNDDKALKKWQGLQISAFMIDEGDHLTEHQIFYLMSRLRSKAKMIPNMWLTCNPDPDSWLFKWVEWYLYPEGHPEYGIPDRSKNGIVRYFVNTSKGVVFGNTADELKEKYPEYFQDGSEPATYTFIAATIFDNPPLLKSNPQYLKNLQSQKPYMKARNLYGSWIARPESSGYFSRNWVGTLESPPIEVKKRVRAWDFAYSLPDEINPDPDYTVGVLMSRTKDGKIVVEDMVRQRIRAGALIDFVAETYRKDVEYYGNQVEVCIPRDAGGAGKANVEHQIRELALKGIIAKEMYMGSKGKLERFMPFSACSEVGGVDFVRGDWNDDWFYELEAFTGNRQKIHDDAVDATADAFRYLAEHKEFDIPINIPILTIERRR